MLEISERIAKTKKCPMSMSGYYSSVHCEGSRCLAWMETRKEDGFSVGFCQMINQRVSVNE
jgi:hypothetical protein